MAQAAAYLICYDIAAPKRLARLQRLVSRLSVMVQYSVYLAWLTPAELAELKEAIYQRINPNEDDVRIYALSERVDVALLQRQDEEVWLLGCGGAQALMQAAAVDEA